MNKKENPLLFSKKIRQNKEKFLKSFSIIKNKNISPKEEVMLGALIIATSGILGFYTFINGPINHREALLKALENARTKKVLAQSDSQAKPTDKDMYSEEEVVQAVETYISSDPNVRISREEYEDKSDTESSLLLTVEHSGSSGELSQYLDTLGTMEKRIIVDNVSYQKDITGLENSLVNIKIPFKIGDNSIRSHSFLLADTEPSTVTTPAPSSAPPTTATPSNKLGSPQANSSTAAKKSTFPKLKSRSSLNSTNKKTNSSSPAKKPDSVTNSANKKPTNTPNPINKTWDKPNLSSDTLTMAPTLVQYSLLDVFTKVESMDGLVLEIQTFDEENNAHTNVKDHWVKLTFSTPGQTTLEDLEENSTEGEKGPQDTGKIEEKDLQLGQEKAMEDGIDSENTHKDHERAKAIEREFRFNTPGLYLPKNAYELSIDLEDGSKTEGSFELVLANEKGEAIIVKEIRRIDTGEGSKRIFFPLKNMDGSIRANQLRYKFIDKVSVDEKLVFKNFQILSNQ